MSHGCHFCTRNTRNPLPLQKVGRMSPLTPKQQERILHGASLNCQTQKNKSHPEMPDWMDGIWYNLGWMPRLYAPYLECWGVFWVLGEKAAPVKPAFFLYVESSSGTGLPDNYHSCINANDNPPANAGDTRPLGSISGLGRSPGVGNGTPLQYSCLENSIGRGAWWATVYGATKSATTDVICPSKNFLTKANRYFLTKNLKCEPFLENPLKYNFQ